MASLLGIIFVASLLASAVLTGVVRAVALRLGIVDRPDGLRKLHGRAVPLWGGVAVYAAVLAGLGIAVLSSLHLDGAPLGDDFSRLALTVAFAGGLICVAGCIDDVRCLRARWKLLLQILAILPVVASGVYADRVVLFGHYIALGWLNLPLTVLWLLGCINAVNLLDGMDGLASTVGMATAAMLGGIALYVGNLHVALVAAALAAALAGFLLHNRPPARIFLGDSGSMTIGLIVGVLGLQSTLKTSTTLAITAPLVVMTFPMFDTVLAVVRRRLTGQGVGVGDRQHIHHRLLERGLEPWKVLGLIGLLCLATGAAAAAATILHSDVLAWVTAATLVVLAVRLRWFGHYEWTLVRRAAGRQALSLAARLRRPVVRPRAAAVPLSYASAWAALRRAVGPWGVAGLELSLAVPGRAPLELGWAGEGPAASDESWSMTIAVRRHARVCRVHARGAKAAGAMPGAAHLARLLRTFAAHFAEQDEQRRRPRLDRRRLLRTPSLQERRRAA